MYIYIYIRIHIYICVYISLSLLLLLLLLLLLADRAGAPVRRVADIWGSRLFTRFVLPPESLPGNDCLILLCGSSNLKPVLLYHIPRT